MQIRDRIKELRRVKAAQLRPNPLNWRTHSAAQRDALCGVLAEIGYAQALLARELPDGSLELIDGHLRAETTPDTEVPVLVLDVDEAEAAKLLATLDPLSSLAGTNQDLLDELLSNVKTQNEAVQSLLDGMARETDAVLDDIGSTPPPDAPPDARIDEAFQVVVECRDESDQRLVFDRLTAEGYKCRLLVL